MLTISENYKNKQQREIKSAFDGQGQFTIFTACTYKVENHQIVCSNHALITQRTITVVILVLGQTIFS